MYSLDRLLRLDGELGTVEAGKRADLCVVRGDPLLDLGLLETALAAVFKVAKRELMGCD